LARRQLARHERLAVRLCTRGPGGWTLSDKVSWRRPNERKGWRNGSPDRAQRHSGWNSAVTLERLRARSWMGCVRSSLLEHHGRGRQKLLGLGSIRLSGTMPNGQYGVLTPRRLYPITHSHATFAGVDLGHTVRSPDTPRIGDIPVSARAVLAIGRAYFEITDPDEYSRTRAALGAIEGHDRSADRRSRAQGRPSSPIASLTVASNRS
jgi:hypothetical protein